MNFISFISIFVIFAIFINNSNCEDTVKEVIVTTKNGKIKGNSIHFQFREINSFMGIRYAEPPIGKLRFAKPQPVGPWNGTYDATKKQNSCWQKPGIDIMAEFSSLNESEDCLFLNVWTPLDLNNKTKNASLLPVMFWIYGGGFSTGSSYLEFSNSMMVYNGIALSTYNVVVVTINYRLGTLGFLYGGTDDTPGNLGLWDQTLALQWVKENIKSFGGNPEEITIFGESAGASAVAFLMISPHSRNLFKRGIAQSMYAPYMHSLYSSKQELEKGIESAKQLSKELGCLSGDEWLSCLKEIDVKKIINHNRSLLNFDPILSINSFFPHGVKEALHSGDFRQNIEIIIGVNKDEGTPVIKNLFPDFSTNKTVSKSQLRGLLTVLKDIFFSQIKDTLKMEDVYKLYLEPINESDQIGLKQAFTRITSDYMSICPAYLFAKNFALYSSKNTAYFYYLTYKSLNLSLCNETWMGVCHTDDLIFTFGVPTQHPHLFSKKDIAFSHYMMKLWTNFAKSGDPVKPEKLDQLIEWNSFRITPESPLVPAIFDLSPDKTNEFMMKDFFKYSCDGLWKPYFE